MIIKNIVFDLQIFTLWTVFIKQIMYVNWGLIVLILHTPHYFSENFTDELKHIIGSETTRRGLLCVFELFQHPVLNRRLLYVLLEGILETLFPQHNLSQIFRKLHSRSGRVRDDFKTSQRTRSDLRRWAPFPPFLSFWIFCTLRNIWNIKCFCDTLLLFPQCSL
jgi:hypothetical protein